MDTLDKLCGPDRRLSMASVVKGIGRRGIAWAKRELEWDRTSICKGMHELESGVVYSNNVGMRGRQRTIKKPVVSGISGIGRHVHLLDLVGQRRFLAQLVEEIFRRGSIRWRSASSSGSPSP